MAFFSIVFKDTPKISNPNIEATVFTFATEDNLIEFEWYDCFIIKINKSEL